MLNKKTKLKFGVIGLFSIILVFLSLSLGSVSIPVAELFDAFRDKNGSGDVTTQILWDVRMPETVTAFLSGVALSLAGLLMQTLFRNPLADPFVLGINSGASLGVAILLLVMGPGAMTLFGHLEGWRNLSLIFSSTVGAISVMSIVFVVASRVNLTTLLIVGLIMGYAVSSIVMVMMFFAIPDRLQMFFSWSFGTFGNLSWEQIKWLFWIVLFGCVGTGISASVMNVMLLGETYSKSMGLSVGFWRLWMIGVSSILTGTVTGFCGPIGFIGIAVPHLTRMVFQTTDHRILIPAVILIGGCLAVLAETIAQVPGMRIVLPLNAIMALVGAPVIFWILFKRGGIGEGRSNV